MWVVWGPVVPVRKDIHPIKSAKSAILLADFAGCHGLLLALLDRELQVSLVGTGTILHSGLQAASGIERVRIGWGEGIATDTGSGTGTVGKDIARRLDDRCGIGVT